VTRQPSVLPYFRLAAMVAFCFLIPVSAAWNASMPHFYEETK
jgi:hypothetical protein